MDFSLPYSNLITPPSAGATGRGGPQSDQLWGRGEKGEGGTPMQGVLLRYSTSGPPPAAGEGRGTGSQGQGVKDTRHTKEE